MANVPGAPISLCLLGSFEVRASDRNINPALDRKTRAILAYLAATGHPLNRQAAWVDCDIFQNILDRHPISTEFEALSSVLDLYRGEFLAGTTLSEAPEFEF